MLVRQPIGKNMDFIEQVAENLGITPVLVHIFPDKDKPELQQETIMRLVATMIESSSLYVYNEKDSVHIATPALLRELKTKSTQWGYDFTLDDFLIECSCGAMRRTPDCIVLDIGFLHILFPDQSLNR